MNLGGRIKQRLDELGWDRADLIALLPEDLTPQSLGQLILRDSKRSEKDVKIANALGVSVLWLVYGDEVRPDMSVNEPAAAYNVQPQHPVFAKVLSMTPAELDKLETLIDIAFDRPTGPRTGATKKKSPSRIRDVTQPADEIERNQS